MALIWRIHGEQQLLFADLIRVLTVVNDGSIWLSDLQCKLCIFVLSVVHLLQSGITWYFVIVELFSLSPWFLDLGSAYVFLHLTLSMLVLALLYFFNLLAIHGGFGPTLVILGRRMQFCQFQHIGFNVKCVVSATKTLDLHVYFLVSGSFMLPAPFSLCPVWQSC